MKAERPEAEAAAVAVRPATAADREGVLAMVRGVYEEKGFLWEGDGYTPVQIAGRTRIGGCDCSLERLYVRSESRRHGIGRMLLETATAHARAHDRRLMEIWSHKDWEDAHRLYRSLGVTWWATGSTSTRITAPSGA